MPISFIIILFIKILLSCINGMIEMRDVPPVTSPSENYVYSIQEEDTYVLVGIYDTEGNLLFMDDEKYYKRFHLIVEWQEDDDILWVYSGDIGVYCIFAKNNEWQKLSHNKSEQIVGKPPRRIARQLASLGLD